MWDDGRGLLYSDVLFGGVFALGVDGAVSAVFEHRRGIGGMSPHVAGGLVVSGRNVSYKGFDGSETVTLLDRDPEQGNVGYNDITTDTEGRIYAGSLGASPVFEDGREPRAGDLYLIDLDGSSRVVGHDVELTNGLGFSPDGRTLYHSDSRRQAVFSYPVLDGGDLGEKRPSYARNAAPRTGSSCPRTGPCGSRWRAAAPSASTSRTARCASTWRFRSRCARASASAARTCVTSTS